MFQLPHQRKVLLDDKEFVLQAIRADYRVFFVVQTGHSNDVDVALEALAVALISDPSEAWQVIGHIGFDLARHSRLKDVVCQEVAESTF